MAVDIVMPQMGESIFEGTITKWLKKPGDKVERDEPLFEISTDKVDAEIPSPSAGVLKEIKVGEGKTVPIQTVVGVIDAAGEASAAKPAQPAAIPKSEAQPAKASTSTSVARCCTASGPSEWQRCASGATTSPHTGRRSVGIGWLDRYTCERRSAHDRHERWRRPHSQLASGPPHGQGTWD